MYDIERLKLVVPSIDLYEKNKDKKLKKTYIKALYKLRGINFFVADESNNLFFKAQKSLSPFSEKYNLTDPFDQNIGQMIYRGKPYRYDIYLKEKDSFSIVKKSSNNEEIIFDLSPLPIILKGDVLGTNFHIWDSQEKKEYAKVTYYSKGNKGLTYEIEWHTTKYRYEIITAIMATKLIQFHTMD